MGQFNGVGRVYLHTVVDTFGGFAFGFLHNSRQREAAASLLHNEVLPFYADQGLAVENVLTHNGREFCGTDSDPCELYLALNGIEHRTTKVHHPHTNGFIERFHLTVQDECFAIKFREQLFESVEALQSDLDEWLQYYNYERPHLCYRNQGRRPFDTVQVFIQSDPIPSAVPATADD